MQVILFLQTKLGSFVILLDLMLVFFNLNMKEFAAAPNHFGKAAEKSYVTQPTLISMIQTLEQELV